MKRSSLWATISLALMAVSPTASAAAAGGHGEEHATFLGLPTWVWLVGNLIIFWGAIFKFAGPPVSRYLDQRRERISEDLALARQQRKEAEELNATLASRIEELEAEMKELVDRTGSQAEDERKALLEQSEQERQRIVEQTRDEIKNRVIVAKKELQEYAAQLATDLAAERLESEVSSADGSRLFDEALERLQKEALP